MKRWPRRDPWHLLLAVVVLAAAVDLARGPGAPDGEGQAAASAQTLRIVVGADDAAERSGADARVLALGLRRSGVRAAVEPSGGSASQTVLGFVARARRDGSRALLVSSGLLAQMERAQREPTSSVEGAQASAALRAMDRLVPLAPVGADAALLLVRKADGPRTFTELAAAVRRRPGAMQFGIASDAASKLQLAGLVHDLRPPGELPYRAFPTEAEVARALASGRVDVALVGRADTAQERRRGELRTLAAGSAGGTSGAPLRANGQWSVLMVPRTASADARHALARRVTTALHGTDWTRYARARGITGPSTFTGLPEFVARQRQTTARDARIAAAIPERTEAVPSR